MRRMTDGGGSADALVTSPRGLAVLSALCGEDLDVWPRRLTGPLGDPTAHPFDRRRPALDAACASLDDPASLAIEVLRAGSGHAWWGNGRLTADAVERRGPAFLEAAHELLSAPGAAWWSEDLVRERQAIVGSPDAAPDGVGRAADQVRLTTSAFHGRIPQVLRTSRRLDGRLPALELCDPDLAPWTGGGPAGCWALRVAEDARVFEVHGPTDWRDLLARYPRRVPTTDDLRTWGVTTPESVVPDWPAFAEDWDGVHVSMLGLLTAQGVPVRVDGLDGALEGVDLAMTAWFRVCWGEAELTATLPLDELPLAATGPS